MQSDRSMAKVPRSLLVLALACGALACAAHPMPAARVGSAEAAVRAAREVGAARTPDAAMHLSLAEQQIASARRLIDEGEPDRAEWLLVRAEADASVASALSREAQAKSAADAMSTRVREAARAEGGER